jgi:hypothetical protein
MISRRRLHWDAMESPEGAQWEVRYSTALKEKLVATPGAEEVSRVVLLVRTDSNLPEE